MSGLKEQDGVFEVPLQDSFVELISLMASRFIRFLVSTDDGTGGIALEGDFVLTTETGSEHLHASRFDTLGPVDAPGGIKVVAMPGESEEPSIWTDLDGANPRGSIVGTGEP